MLKKSRALLLLALAAGVLAAGGCGNTTIDQGDAEDLVKNSVGQVENAGAVKTVDCPSDQEAKKGATFTCDVTTDTGSGKATLSVGEVTNDQVNVTVTNLDLAPNK
jgi:hypothetical protein